MAAYLIDANILSEPTKPQPLKPVIDWIGRNETELAVNPIILGELQYGILQLPASRRRNRLMDWFLEGPTRIAILDIDRETAKIWANLLVILKRKGRAMPLKDSLIAATALQYELTIATRNSADYRHVGVRLVNPFDG